MGGPAAVGRRRRPTHPKGQSRRTWLFTAPTCGTQLFDGAHYLFRRWRTRSNTENQSNLALEQLENNTERPSVSFHKGRCRLP
jgi:hypothetical protein